jgi:hypothetical protein
MKTKSMIRHLEIGAAAKVRNANRSGNILQATVVDVFYDRVAVQVGAGGTILRGLKLIGGPVTAGDNVMVDFSSDPPVVVAKGTEYLSMSDLEDALRRLSDGVSENKTRFEIVLFSGGGVVEIFSPTLEGLTSALGAAGDGDLVVVPDINITGDFTLNAGASLSGFSSRQSIIRGTITLEDGALLENMKIVATDRSTGTIKGIVAQSTDKIAYIRDCEIHSYQCDTGTSYGIELAT